MLIAACLKLLLHTGQGTLSSLPVTEVTLLETEVTEVTLLEPLSLLPPEPEVTEVTLLDTRPLLSPEPASAHFLLTASLAL